MQLEKERLERIQRAGEYGILVYISWDRETFG